MRRRHGFTLVEMLVATALVLFTMAILTEAFVAGLDTFSKLKAVGDMEEKLRTATTLLRRDLAADHFEGRRRLSDPSFWILGTPREGFFRIVQGPPTGLLPAGISLQDEASDGDGIPSRRRTTHLLHFSVKLRGNRRESFFSANVPPTSPLFAATNFFNQPADARYQDTPGIYNSQWAEVAYWLKRTGTTALPTDTASAETSIGPKPLFALYRSQFVVVPDNSSLNWSGTKIAVNNLTTYLQLLLAYNEVSCKKSNPTPVTFAAGEYLYFNNPSDLADPTASRRVFQATPPDPSFQLDPTRGLPPFDRSPRGGTLLLTDVLSFDIQILQKLPPNSTVPPPPPIYDTNGLAQTFGDLPPLSGGTFDTSVAPNAQPPNYLITAVQITIRVWDAKTQQARQITIVQDM
jgi:prepilin-type N-terminal cleavage/methylation domain-containing protein